MFGDPQALFEKRQGLLVVAHPVVQPRQAVEAGGRIGAVTPQRVSLESIFLDAVREEEQ